MTMVLGLMARLVRVEGRRKKIVGLKQRVLLQIVTL
jgi:hypothetical protein